MYNVIYKTIYDQIQIAQGIGILYRPEEVYVAILTIQSTLCCLIHGYRPDK